jgi:hypothetical protein
MEKLVLQVKLVHKEQRVWKEDKVSLDLLVIQVTRGLVESKEFVVQLAMTEQLVNQALMVQQEKQVLRVNRAQLVHRVKLVLEGSVVTLVLKESKEKEVLQAEMALEVKLDKEVEMV